MIIKPRKHTIESNKTQSQVEYTYKDTRNRQKRIHIRIQIGQAKKDDHWKPSFSTVSQVSSVIKYSSS